jgi:hypothetical protein
MTPMTTTREIRSSNSMTPRTGAYERPRLTLIGDGRRVILGVPGGGDDYFGFSRERFEFEPDSSEPVGTK